jgi:putative acetyltransferase
LIGFVREERPVDRESVRAVNEAAFSGPDEADLVRRLYDDDDALLGLVAEVEGQVVGHILFSRLPIETVQGVVFAAALAPLAVMPDWQGQGIGTALVREGLTRCRERGVAAVVVLGDSDYYGRFGFRAEMASGLQTPWSGPFLMAVELVQSGLAGGQGVARYPAAFGELPSE